MTNTGTATLSSVAVSDNLIASVSCPYATLAPGAFETCTGSYTVTQADVDAGAVTNTATASANPPTGSSITSASSSVTVEASGVTSSLTLVKSTTSTGYGAAGDTIDYSYMVTNTGGTTLSSVAVSDNKVASVSCPDATLVPGAGETCTGSYAVTQADVDAGAVTNMATASANPPTGSSITSASSSVTVEASSAISSLTLVKSTTSTGYGAAGDTIDYGYAVTNNGTTTLSGVAVSDNLIASVSCPDATLAPGASETCAGSYTVTQADVNAGSVTNTATASANPPTGSSIASPSSSVTVEASSAISSLTLVKSTTTTGYGAAGNTIDYSYVVTNNGTTTLSSVAVSDNKVASVSCPDATLAPGASETCTGTYSVTQADVDAGSVTNTATASATAPPSGQTITSASSSVTVDASESYPSLTLVKSTTSTGYGAAGDTIDYSYVVTNNGTTSLSGVAVSDNLIASVSCPDATLAPGASETCTGSYTVTQADVNAGSVTNTATASAIPPSGSAITSGSSSVTVEASDATSSLTLVKSTTSTGYGAAGDTIDYSYVVTNTGSTTLSSVAVSDNKVASVSCPDATLAPAASETCTGTYAVTQADVDAGSVTNTATASADPPTGSSISSATSSVTVDASQRYSSLTLVKSTTSTGYGAAGATIHYSYALTNNGTTTLSSVAVSDNKVASVSCPDATLAPGASETCTGSYTVTQADVNAGSVTNTATASANPPTGSSITSATSSVTVEASGATSSLTLAKSTNSTGYGAAGDTIDYSYVVTNTGTTTLHGVAVSDNKVASVSCPDATLAPAASETCTGTYSVTQSDVDTGAVTNTATASATAPPSGHSISSGSSSVTVEASGRTSGLALTESASPGTFAAAGTTIHFSYFLTNNGTTTLTGLAVSDSRVASVSCPSSSLAPGSGETCTGATTTTSADVSAAVVTSTATATGTDPSGAVVSNSSSADVAYTGFHITTTSLPSTTVGQSYSVTLGATGGTAPYKWTAVSALPKGLKLSAAGVLSGTAPTYVGNYTISVKAADTKTKTVPSVTVTRSWTLVVNAQPGPSGVTCSKLTGSALGSIEISGCLPKGGTAYSDATGPASALASVGTPGVLTWSGGATTTVVPSAVNPVAVDACKKGSSEVNFVGMVTAESGPAGIGIPEVGDTVSANACVSGSLTLTLAPGQKMNL